MEPKRRSGDTYQVIVSPDKKYSLISAGTPVPSGWRALSRQGTKQECIKYIEEVWTDMTAVERDRLLRK